MRIIFIINYFFSIYIFTSNGRSVNPSFFPSQSPTKSPTVRPTTRTPTTYKPTTIVKQPTPKPTNAPWRTLPPTFIDGINSDTTDDIITTTSSFTTNIIVLVTVLSIIGLTVLSAGGYFIWSLNNTVSSMNQETEVRPLMEKVKRRDINPI